ncbi:MAG: AbrB/MazE/SpoVT family DNA-binding domain-containing protein [bacterium]
MKVSSKGQITIPREIREKLNLSPGEEIVFEQTGEGFVLKRKTEELFPRDEPGADSPLASNTAAALSMSRGSLGTNES